MSKIEDIKSLLELLKDTDETKKQTIDFMVGDYVIIRTYSAGCWFGKLHEKMGNEVVLKNARRMWSWKAKKSIALSGCAVYGIDHKHSKICPAVEEYVWLEAIEILALTKEAEKSLKSAPDVEAE